MTNDPKTDAPLATTTLCTIARSADGLVDIQIGSVILRLPERDVASLSGTLKGVVHKLFPRSDRPSVQRRFEVIEGGRA